MTVVAKVLLPSSDKTVQILHSVCEWQKHLDLTTQMKTRYSRTKQNKTGAQRNVAEKVLTLILTAGLPKVPLLEKLK
jgi:hypothetical protein